jgi:predicted enzyme related to lactoylglutathione lyase
MIDLPRLTTWGLLMAALLTASPAEEKADGKAPAATTVHYLEIVTRDVAAQCVVLERVHGVTFGPAVADLGQARVAQARGGYLIGVRSPLADHEQPIVRTYLEVDDIAKAVKEAEAAGAVIAYPPTRQGDTGTWAIYIVGDLQFGLWQR